MNGFDRHICLWVNGWPEWLSPFLTFFSVAMTYPAIKALFGVMLLLMLWRNPRTRVAAVLCLLAFGMANGMTDLFKHILPTHRPFQPEALGSLINLRVGGSNNPGTASAHAANMAAVATVMSLQLGRWGWPWIAIAVLTGISRVYVGVHFPSQVLLGLACGCTAGFACTFAYRAIAKRYSKAKNNEC